MLWNIGKKRPKKFIRNFSIHNMNKGLLIFCIKEKRAPFYGILKHSTAETRERFYSMQMSRHKSRKRTHANLFLQMDDMR